jgi:hypothetical protein
LVKPESVPDDFTNCADLPMLNFIKITVTGDLKWLGKCAYPEKLWESIHSEYCELSGDTQSSIAFDLAKQIHFLTNKINITNSIVNILSLRGFNEVLIAELKGMGYRLQYVDLERDLLRTLSLSKSDHIKLDAAKEKYTKLSTGKETSEFEWYQILSALAKHRQIVSINPALISVTEYVAMDKEFRDYINMMKQATR